MKLLKLLTLGLAIGVTISSCDLINPDETVASYLYIEDLDLVDNLLVAEGGLEEDISNVQVFVGGDFLGVFTLPALVPVLQEGTQPIVIDPVVKENGQTFVLNVYPFYERYIGEVNLTPAEIDTISPEITYVDDFEIGFIEDFELGGNIFNVDRDGNLSTFVGVTTEEVFDGGRSGMIYLDEDNVFIDVSTDESDLFPIGEANQIWLEVTIKTDMNVLFGLIGYQGGATSSSFEYGALANDSWRKIYYNLGAEVFASGFENYGIALTAGLPLEEGEFLLSEGFIYLDNIKLLYR